MRFVSVFRRGSLTLRSLLVLVIIIDSPKPTARWEKDPIRDGGLVLSGGVIAGSVISRFQNPPGVGGLEAAIWPTPSLGHESRIERRRMDREILRAPSCRLEALEGKAKETTEGLSVTMMVLMD